MGSVILNAVENGGYFATPLEAAEYVENYLPAPEIIDVFGEPEPNTTLPSHFWKPPSRFAPRNTVLAQVAQVIRHTAHRVGQPPEHYFTAAGSGSSGVPPAPPVSKKTLEEMSSAERVPFMRGVFREYPEEDAFSLFLIFLFLQDGESLMALLTDPGSDIRTAMKKHLETMRSRLDAEKVPKAVEKIGQWLIALEPIHPELLRIASGQVDSVRFFSRLSNLSGEKYAGWLRNQLNQLLKSNLDNVRTNTVQMIREYMNELYQSDREEDQGTALGFKQILKAHGLDL